MVLCAFRGGRPAAVLLAIAGVAAVPGPAQAQLFWDPPSFAGAPVNGDEPGIALPLPGATPAEQKANMMWGMRAGLNVAALQCQFSPTLMTVKNYNTLLAQHAKELNTAYTAITKYFQRTVKGIRPAQTALDQYTTRTYNGFSTLHAQLGFCQTASKIGYEALGRPAGKLNLTVANRMREFRNSLVPVEDRVHRALAAIPPDPVPPLQDDCWNRRQTLKDECRGTLVYATAQR